MADGECGAEEVGSESGECGDADPSPFLDLLSLSRSDRACVARDLAFAFHWSSSCCRSARDRSESSARLLCSFSSSRSDVMISRNWSWRELSTTSASEARSSRCWSDLFSSTRFAVDVYSSSAMASGSSGTQIGNNGHHRTLRTGERWHKQNGAPNHIQHAKHLMAVPSLWTHSLSPLTLIVQSYRLSSGPSSRSFPSAPCRTSVSAAPGTAGYSSRRWQAALCIPS